MALFSKRFALASLLFVPVSSSMCRDAAVGCKDRDDTNLLQIKKNVVLGTVRSDKEASKQSVLEKNERRPVRSSGAILQEELPEGAVLNEQMPIMAIASGPSSSLGAEIIQGVTQAAMMEKEALDAHFPGMVHLGISTPKATGDFVPMSGGVHSASSYTPGVAAPIAPPGYMTPSMQVTDASFTTGVMPGVAQPYVSGVAPMGMAMPGVAQPYPAGYAPPYGDPYASAPMGTMMAPGETFAPGYAPGYAPGAGFAPGYASGVSQGFAPGYAPGAGFAPGYASGYAPGLSPAVVATEAAAEAGAQQVVAQTAEQVAGNAQQMASQAAYQGAIAQNNAAAADAAAAYGGPMMPQVPFVQGVMPQPGFAVYPQTAAYPGTYQMR